MKITRHETHKGPRWAADGHWLTEPFDLGSLLANQRAVMEGFIARRLTNEPADGVLMAPLEDHQEVWASGVTYQRSREARQAESVIGNVYDRVYSAQRPELFFKAPGWRVVAHQKPVRIRADSSWNVPEPELVLVLNAYGEIVGYTAGNDMSSRSIEGENPLYLPQAKMYNGSCALGPALHLLDDSKLDDLPIELTIERGGEQVFQASIRTSRMERRLPDLADYLFRELAFPQGAFLFTGTGIVPPEEFSLTQADRVIIQVGDLTLINEIGA
jgi:2-dehydro-3-deoxy-D-arabinonate dehydratase